MRELFRLLSPFPDTDKANISFNVAFFFLLKQKERRENVQEYAFLLKCAKW